MDNDYESALKINKVLLHFLYCYFVITLSHDFVLTMGGNSVLKCFGKPSREGECAPSDQQVAISLFGAVQWRGLALPARRRPVALPVRLPAAVCGNQGDVAAAITAPLPGRADQELPGEGSWSWR